MRNTLRRRSLALLALPFSLVSGSVGTSALASASGLALTPTSASSQPAIRVVVDPRVELMTIVFRLAGAPEYSHAEVTSYARDVDAHFSRFKNHPAVVRAKALRESHGISFGDPMALALQLTAPPELAERVPLEPFPHPHTRWTPAEARAFVSDLRGFARDSNLAAFLSAHEPLHKTAIERANAMVRETGVASWFTGFFRRPQGSYVIVVNVLFGSGSFGGLRTPSTVPAATPGTKVTPSVDDFYVVLGTRDVDGAGLPAYPPSCASVVAHEFAHTFVSPIVTANLSKLMPAAERIYPLVRSQMELQAYGPGETILHESIVRACSVRFAAGRGTEAGRRQAAFEHERGFRAVPMLADLLAEYERDRASYPTLESFAPRLVTFFEEYSRAAEAEAAAIDAERGAKLAAGTGPTVLAMVPAEGAEVEAESVTALVVTFDRPMRHMAVMTVPGAATPAFSGRPTFDSTNRVLTIPCRLEPGTAYALQLNSEQNMLMTDEQGNPLKPVTWRFRTK